MRRVLDNFQSTRKLQRFIIFLHNFDVVRWIGQWRVPANESNRVEKDKPHVAVAIHRLSFSREMKNVFQFYFKVHSLRLPAVWIPLTPIGLKARGYEFGSLSQIDALLIKDNGTTFSVPEAKEWKYKDRSDCLLKVPDSALLLKSLRGARESDKPNKPSIRSHDSPASVNVP